MYYNSGTARYVCKKCDVRVPRNRPKLVCSICKETKHWLCEKLNKNDAIYLIKNHPFDWICSGCILETLPINACSISKSQIKVKTKFAAKCSACQGNSYSEKNVTICPWCEGISHVKCVKGDLGCTKCCADIIPGYNCNSYELTNDTPKIKSIYNPYCRTNLINQIGEKFNVEEETDTMWSDISDFFAKM